MAFFAGCGGGGSPDLPPEAAIDTTPSRNLPPEAKIDAAPSRGAAPLAVRFDSSSSSDRDGRIVDSRWSFGDGSEDAYGVVVSHVFAAAGSYRVRLTVIDDQADEARAECTVTVLPPVNECPAFAAPVAVGTVSDERINECSGLAWSRTQNVLWLHNDSGDSARVFAISGNGTLLAVVTLSGATAHDWEDMAMGPYPGGGDALHIADIGDNAASRSYVRIYRVPEPAITGATPQNLAVANFDSFRLVYPDRPHNAETFMVDPENGDVYIVTKEKDGRSTVFAAACPANGAVVTMHAVASLVFGVEPLSGSPLPTGGDIAPDGSMVIIRTYNRAFLFRRPLGGSLADAFAMPPCRVPAPSEYQGEAIAFAADGASYWTLGEGANQSLYRVDMILPAAP